LIDGELIDKMGKKQPHVIGTGATVDALKEIFGREYVVQEAPIDVAAEDNERNEPEPDIVVLRRPYRTFGLRPGPADVLLLVEVAGSSLGQDLSTKAKLYARAGIPEYWVLDVENRRMHVHRDPAAGSYGTRFEIDSNGAAEPQAKPGHSVPLAKLLP
jgi:Uma2 family endonuclease